MGSGASKNHSSDPASKASRRKKHSRGGSAHHSSGSSQEVIEVVLTKAGFLPCELTINEGQEVSITWDGNISHNVRQVVIDNQIIHSVPGGYYSGDPSLRGNFEIDFNLEGEYTFISDGYDAKSGKSLAVTVRSRSSIIVQITDNGFSSSIIHIRQDSKIKWQWNSCHIPHSVREVTLCPKHTGIITTNTSNSNASQSGSYVHNFKAPGLYYFQTEGESQGQLHLCIVHVKETARHYGIEVTDRKFHPRLLTVKTGDRVSWHWNKFKCKKQHRILEVMFPSGHNVSDPFPRVVKGGFASEAPSRCGMLSNTFYDPGVYYYCDNNYEDNREYLGVIIVYPRENEHHVEVTADGFYPDMNVVSAGDRIWWEWEIDKVQDVFSILQVESCTVGNQKHPADLDCNDLCQYLNEESAAMVTGVGMATINVYTPGVYQYRISDTPISVGGCSAVVNPSQKDHTVTVTDYGFEPKVLTIHPRDRVWWVWKNTKSQHNIVQVSCQGQLIRGGFSSGLPRDSPAAFMMQFKKLEPVYFISAGLPNLYGAIVVVDQSRVHQVRVCKNQVHPDPVLVESSDCIAWIWPVLRTHGLTQVHGTQQVFELQSYTRDVVTPRRCCALTYTETGLYHYFSKAFSDKGDKYMFEHSSKAILSSVVVSDSHDIRQVQVSSKCFNPPVINIHKGQTVLWSWKESSSEKHNIVHVNPPDHFRCYQPVAGPDAFSSGKPQANCSYMHSFQETGSFYFTSEGASGCVSTVNVLENEVHTSMPLVISKTTAGTVEKWHKVELACNTEGAIIMYTMDGAIPEQHGPTTKVYKKEKGICLKKSGLHIIRAIAISDHVLPSRVFTSARFWVLEGGKGDSSDDEDDVSIATEDYEEEQKLYTTGPTPKWQWWQCVPEIQGWFVEAGCLEIYWEIPQEEYRSQVNGYQLFVNDICYHSDLPANCNSLKLQGLGGGCTYHVSLVVMPKEQVFLPHQSNRLVVQVPVVSDLGGPIISCECVRDKDNCICLIWPAITIYGQQPSYMVYVNGKKYDDKLLMESDTNTPPRVIVRADMNDDSDVMKIFVLCLPPDKESESDGNLSNTLDIPMPITTEHMRLPADMSVKYLPYVMVKEGSGKSPGDDTILLPSWNAEEDGDLQETSITQIPTTITEVSTSYAPSPVDPSNEVPTSDNKVEVKSEDGCSQQHDPNPMSCMRVMVYYVKPTKEKPEINTKEETLDAEKEETKGMENDREKIDSGEMVENIDTNSNHIIEEKYLETNSKESEKRLEGEIRDDENYAANTKEKPGGRGEKQEIGVQMEINGEEQQDVGGLGTEQNQIKEMAESVEDEVAKTKENLQVEKETEEIGENEHIKELDKTRANNECQSETKTGLEHTENNTDNNKEKQKTNEKLISMPDSKESPELRNVSDDLDDKSIQIVANAQTEQDSAEMINNNQPAVKNAKEISVEGEQPCDKEVNEQHHGKLDSTNCNNQQETLTDDCGLKGSHNASEMNSENQNQVLTNNLDISDETSTKENQEKNNQEKKKLDDTNVKIELFERCDGSLETGVDVTDEQKENMKLTGNTEDNFGRMQAKPSHSIEKGDDIGKVKGSQEVKDCSLQKVVGDNPEKDKVVSCENVRGDSPNKDKYSRPQKVKGHNPEKDEDNYSPHKDKDDSSEKGKDDSAKRIKRVKSAKRKRSFKNKERKSVKDEEMQKNMGDGGDDMKARFVEERKHGTKRTNLPIPMVSAQTSPMNAGLTINWQCQCLESSSFTLHHFMVNIEGGQFDKSIDSHFSKAEFNGNRDGGPILQHSWNAGQTDTYKVNGLCENTTYSAFVTAVYSHQDLNRKQVRIHSKHIQCTTGGPPLPPILHVTGVDCQEITMGWDLNRCHEDIEVDGFILVRNKKATPEMIPYGIAGKTVKNLKPGSKYQFSLIMVTSDGRKTKPSNTITVTCPREPDAIQLNLDDMCRDNARITWHGLKGKHVTSYFIYIDGEFHGEVKVNDHDPKSLQYNSNISMTELKPGQSQTVTVKAYAGLRTLDSPKKEALCGVLGPDSNCVIISQKDLDAPIVTPIPSLEGMHPDGIDISWELPEEQVDVIIAGYVILKDGEPVPPLLASNVTQSTVTEVKLGSTVNLQVVAFAGPPGSPVSTNTDEESKIEDILDNYTACEPGPVLQVQYVGLVPPPPRVWTEAVSGQSGLIVWEKGKKPRKHYRLADSYVVRWWESEEENAPENSESTTDDHLLISNLNPGTEYSIIVESRGQHEYMPHNPQPVVADSEDDEEDTDNDHESYICLVSGESDVLTIRTASPPIPPSDLRVAIDYRVAHLTWSPPIERGTDIITLRIYATKKTPTKTKTVFTTDLPPDSTDVAITWLQEATLYTLHLVTFTEEFFDQLPPDSPYHNIRFLPHDWDDELLTLSPWIIVISAKFTTAGHTPPTDLEAFSANLGEVTVKWVSPIYAYGALEKYEVEWSEAKHKRHSPNLSSAGSVDVEDEDQMSVVLQDLIPGRTYDFSVTSVLKKDKTSIKKDADVEEEDVMRFSSEVLRYRVPAPIEALELLLSGYGCGHIDLCWAKPELFSPYKITGETCISATVRQHLLGYRLDVNGVTHCHFAPNTLSCTLTQCEPEKTYDVILVAMTTTDKQLAKRLAGKTVKLSKLGRTEYDAGLSDVMSITMPKFQSGNIISVIGKYRAASGDEESIEEDQISSGTDRESCGFIRLTWELLDCGTPDEQGIVGYELSWINAADGSEETASVSSTESVYDIPVYTQGCVIDISVQAKKEDHIWQDEDAPSIRVVVPGPPNPPKLCCTMISPEEFILEWGEPRMYGRAGIRGYQVYMNNKKVGHELTTEHHKAAIPSRPERTYRMSIVALPNDSQYDNSLPSETLEIQTPSITHNHEDDKDVATMWQERHQKNKKRPLQLREHPENISLGLVDSTDTTIIVEWRLPLNEDKRQAIDRIRVEWSSVSKPKELQTLLKPHICQYTIKNCSPGTNHFVTVVTLDKSDKVISRSRQLNVQTGAPIATPILKLGEITYGGCHLEWTKPTEFGKVEIIAYKLRVNGKTFDELPPKTTNYLYTNGRMCKDYQFTIQALAHVSAMDSQQSEPVCVTWPGVAAPALHRAPTGKVNSIRVTWNEPLRTGGARIRYFKLTCQDDKKDQQDQLHNPPKCTSPLPWHATSAEFCHLKPHINYSIAMNIHLESFNRPVRSRLLVTQVAKRPLPPRNLRVEVMGYGERCDLEAEACELICCRDRLLEELSAIHRDVKVECTTNGYSAENAEARGELSILRELSEVEQNLVQCLEDMNAYTGYVSLDLFWEPEVDDGDAKITAYKVLVNGKQHGFLINSCVTDLRMQLNAYDCLHQIHMIAMTKHPIGNSNISDPVDIDLSPFLPYNCYCLMSVHKEDARHPDSGCCGYQYTLAQELSVRNSALKSSVYQRSSTRRIPPPSIMVTEVFDGTRDLLVPSKLSNMTPTVILFWTAWCLSSQKMMSYFVEYARSRAEKYIFITCCIGSQDTPDSDHPKSVAELIANSGWQEEGAIRHCCGCTSRSVLDKESHGARMVNRPKYESRFSSASTDSQLTIPELFGIQAVPMLVVIHPKGYISWQGFLTVLDNESFNVKFDDILRNVLTDLEHKPYTKTESSATYKSGLPSSLSSTSHDAPRTVKSATPCRSPSAFSQPPPKKPKPSKNSSIERAKKILSIEHGPYSATTKRDGRAGSSKRPKSSVTM